MEAAAGHALDDAAVGLAHAVYRETDGNPFFVSEVLASPRRDRGDLPGRRRAGGSPADARATWRCRTASAMVIGARVGRLGPDAERVLSLAAVIGRDFDLEVLAARTDDVRGRAARHPRRGRRRRRWCASSPTTPGHYSFAHALIQHTLYEDLGPTRRARAHRRVAEALEELCRRPSRARGSASWPATGSARPNRSTPAKALDYSRQAADAALAALAPADALRYYTQALDLCSAADDPDPILGRSTWPSGSAPPNARPATPPSATRSSTPPAGRRARRHRTSRGRRPGQQPGHRRADRHDRRRQGRDPGAGPRSPRRRPAPSERSCSPRCVGAHLRDRPLERRQALADEALAIAESSGDDATIVRVLNHLGDPAPRAAAARAVVGPFRRRAERAERVGDPVLLFFAAGYRAMIAPRSGDIDEMDRCLDIEVASSTSSTSRR